MRRRRRVIETGRAVEPLRSVGVRSTNDHGDAAMPILLWLLGVPIPIIILLLLFFHH